MGQQNTYLIYLPVLRISQILIVDRTIVETFGMNSVVCMSSCEKWTLEAVEILLLCL